LASAEYWKYFMVRFDGVHASGYNFAGSELILMKFGALWGHCLLLALADFWAQSIQKRERDSKANFLLFWQVSNARLSWFPVGQISQNLHTRRGSVRWWILSEQNFENFPVSGRFFKTAQIVHQNLEHLPTSGRHCSATLQIDENSQPNGPSAGYPLSIFTGILARSASLPVFSLLRGRYWGFSPHRGDTLHRWGWNLARSSSMPNFTPIGATTRV